MRSNYSSRNVLSTKTILAQFMLTYIIQFQFGYSFDNASQYLDAIRLPDKSICPLIKQAQMIPK
jgi:hypothetical protein